MDFEGPEMLSLAEAASLILDVGLTVEQYNKLRMVSLSKKACIYPPYKNVVEFLKTIQPKLDETPQDEVRTGMQAVLNLQVSQIVPTWLQ